MPTIINNLLGEWDLFPDKFCFILLILYGINQFILKVDFILGVKSLIILAISIKH